MQTFLHTLLVTVVMAAPALANDAVRAAASFKRGTELLQKGEFENALQAWADAARADSANADYRNEYAVLRRVIMLRKALDKESNPTKWQTDAQAVRSFYYARELYSEAATLDQQAHERFKNADTATLLGESLLALDRDADAERVLAGVNPLPPKGNLLLGLAQARTGKLDEAKKAAVELKLPADADASLLIIAGRLEAAVGRSDSALGLIKRALETTRPSQIEAVRAQVAKFKEFSSISETADFKTALATASKVSESKCSTGKDCGSCASKTKCSVSATPKAEEQGGTHP